VTCNVVPRSGEGRRQPTTRLSRRRGYRRRAARSGGLRCLAASPMGGEGGGRASQIGDLGGGGLLVVGGLRSQPCSD
jgi:hypothetical protein